MNRPKNTRTFLAMALAALTLLTVTGAAGAGAASMPPPGTPNSPAEFGRGYSLNLHYKFVNGSALLPRDSSSGWDYGGVGCVSRASGSDLFNVYLGLPEGSRVDYLRIFYYDTSASNSTAWITSYNSSGGFNDITSVLSAGSGGYGTQLSPYVGHVVDNASNAYVLNWSAVENGSTMRLCGLRVAYRVPTLDVYMPLITKG